MTRTPVQPLLDTDLLRASIRDEYATVATEPQRGFHFHTGGRLATLLGYGAPSFNGCVTTAPTTAGTAASLAATVAGSQRWWQQPFNYLESVALRWLAGAVDEG